MALSQSVVSELLEAFRVGEGVDLIRESVRLVMQELIETEATQQIGAGRYERAETRVTDRNGSRARLVATQASDVRLRIPKLRKGSFFPAILEHLQVRGVPDLRRPRRAGRSVPFPAAAPHRVPLCVPRRHLPARPPHRRRRAGDQHGRRDRHRSHRHRRS
jgi:hypothetical protein